MSRLYASIDSDARKTTATSRGHKHIDTHTRGWNLGCRVVATVAEDRDVFLVYATSGSSGGESDILLGTLKHLDSGSVAFIPAYVGESA